MTTALNTTYTVFWDTPRGYDWDETYDTFIQAYHRYCCLEAPYKSIVMTDRVHGDRTVIDSAGTDNLTTMMMQGDIDHVYDLLRYFTK